MVAVLRDHKGYWLHGILGFLGDRDILFVGLSAMKMGHLVAWDLSYQEVLAETNFMEVLRLITKDHSPYHIYRALLAEIQSILSRQWRVHVSHILRDANHCADAMARRVAHQREAPRNWHSHPAEVLDLISANTAEITYIHS